MKKNPFLLISVQLLIGLLLWYSLSQINYSFDFTADKRYTLHPKTLQLLKQLAKQETSSSPIEFKIYLTGELPYDYKKLKENTAYLLEEFKRKSKYPLSFNFIDPYAIADEKKREQLFESLSKEGLKYSAQEFEEAGGTKKKIIFPAGLVYYQDKKIPIQLLQGQFLSQSNPLAIEQAVGNLEYILAQSIAKIIQTKKIKIGFTQSNGELAKGNLKDIFTQLSTFYSPEFLSVQENKAGLELLEQYPLLLIAHPTKPYSEAQKYVLDQYLMGGGKIIWMLSTLTVPSDSLKRGAIGYIEPLKLNVDDMFFKYGVKLNYNLVADAFCLPLQIPAGQTNGQTVYKNAHWYFNPVISAQNHAIGKNVNPLLLHYTSSLEIISMSAEGKSPNITPLLQSSQYSTLLKVPAAIHYNMALQPLEKMAKQYIPYNHLALWIGGNLESLYKNRPSPLKEEVQIKVSSQNQERHILLISDGDFVYNAFNPATGEYVPAGFDFVRGEVVYGNVNFLMNAIDDLLLEHPLYELRSRNFKVHPLDAEKIRKEKNFWQWFNVAIPLLMVILIGLGFGIRRFGRINFK